MSTNREVAEQAGAKVHEPDSEAQLEMSNRARQELGEFFDELERRGNTREEFQLRRAIEVSRAQTAQAS